jgi:hypothetical protein
MNDVTISIASTVLQVILVFVAGLDIGKAVQGIKEHRWFFGGFHAALAIWMIVLLIKAALYL